MEAISYDIVYMIKSGNRNNPYIIYGLFLLPDFISYRLYLEAGNFISVPPENRLNSP